MAYTLSDKGHVIRDRDGAIIPSDQRNSDYQDYLAWVAVGNSAVPYVAPPATEADYAAAIQSQVDTTAKSKGYADGVALAGYSTSTIPAWSAEAASFIAWRDQVWVYAYTELAKVQGGQRAQPKIDDLIAELPTIKWPD